MWFNYYIQVEGYDDRFHLGPVHSPEFGCYDNIPCRFLAFGGGGDFGARRQSVPWGTE